MPKVPSSYPADSRLCDVRLPEAALTYRMASTPRLTTLDYLGSINVTAWLYLDSQGIERIQVNPNTTIAELIRQFGPADTPDAEVGFHSEFHAAEWFRTQRGCKILQIFSERIPCARCGPFLRLYYPGVPWYYYFDRRSWRGSNNKLVKNAAEVLKSAYGL